jgi:hypothetical protein
MEPEILLPLWCSQEPGSACCPQLLELNNFGNLRKFHTEEFHNLYSSPNIIRMIKSRRIKWAGHVKCVGVKRSACRVLVGKSEGKRPIRRPRLRSVDNSKTNLREIGWGDMDRRLQWACGLRHELSSPDRTLGSCVRISLEAWMSVCVYSVFVSGSGLATGWSLVQGALPNVLE